MRVKKFKWRMPSKVGAVRGQFWRPSLGEQGKARRAHPGRPEMASPILSVSLETLFLIPSYFPEESQFQLHPLGIMFVKNFKPGWILHWEIWGKLLWAQLKRHFGTTEPNHQNWYLKMLINIYHIPIIQCQEGLPYLVNSSVPYYVINASKFVCVCEF